ncbi:MAG: hypothetical protein ACLTAY_10825 [Thomasclavelia ramosa]
MLLCGGWFVLRELSTVDRSLNIKNWVKLVFCSCSNRGKIPSTTFPLDIRNLIISTYINDYSDTNFTHFCGNCQRRFLSIISISDTTLNIWLRSENMISPEARKKTKSLEEETQATAR